MSLKIKDSKKKSSRTTQKFPRYFIVDGDIPVKIDINARTKEVFAINSFGNPYSPIKALCEGVEVSFKQFDSARYALSYP